MVYSLDGVGGFLVLHGMPQYNMGRLVSSVPPVKSPTPFKG